MNIQETGNFLKELNISPRKRLGQNFLINGQLAQKIVSVKFEEGFFTRNHALQSKTLQIFIHTSDFYLNPSVFPWENNEVYSKFRKTDFFKTDSVRTNGGPI